MTASHSDSLLEILRAALTMMLGQIPMMLAYAAALIILIVRWRQAPRASLLALCGLLFGLFLLVLVPFIYTWLPRKYMSGDSSATEMQTVYAVIGLAVSFAHAVSFGFLFLAIYADRRGYPATPPLR